MSEVWKKCVELATPKTNSGCHSLRLSWDCKDSKNICAVRRDRSYFSKSRKPKTCFLINDSVLIGYQIQPCQRCILSYEWQIATKITSKKSKRKYFILVLLVFDFVLKYSPTQWLFVFILLLWRKPNNVSWKRMKWFKEDGKAGVLSPNISFLLLPVLSLAS